MNLLRLFHRPPDFKIGRADDVYMNRWYVIPRNRWFNIYLHKIVRDDDPQALHDHPWWNISIVLKGGYWEVMPRQKFNANSLAREYDKFPATQRQFSRLFQEHRRKWRRPGSIIFRCATDAHRLELRHTQQWMEGDTRWHLVSSPLVPAWSLFITGPNKREWGFWCRDGWRSHKQFVRKNEHGNEVGAGCGEDV